MDISILQKNYILVPVAIVFYLVFVHFLNSSLDKDKKTNYTTAIPVGIISFALVYLHTLVPAIEEVITSPPPF